MHPNPAFRNTTTDKNITFARERSFGVLAVNHEAGPLVSHIPFHLSADGSYLEAHLVRSNPIAGLIKAPKDAVMIVSGPDGYVSPDWYGLENQVPTWNYVAVHLRGKLRLLEQGALEGILDRLSEAMEGQLTPKKPWTTAKMDAEVYERMRRQIVPIGMDITEINGTWKLSQNKPDAARIGAADGMLSGSAGVETLELSKLMKL